MVANLFEQMVRSRARAAAADWLGDALSLARLDRGRPALLGAFAGAGRRLGREPVEPSAEERERLDDAGVKLPAGVWGLDTLGRIALLLAWIPDLPATGQMELVDELFYRGEIRERQAVLSALSLLPDPARFVDLAAEGCRTNAESTFDAIACENPFPARHFPDAAFNQMVLKAIFIGTAVDRIVDLDARVSPELARMVEGYASERRAAGRSVPDDVERIVAAAGRAR